MRGQRISVIVGALAAVVCLRVAHAQPAAGSGSGSGSGSGDEIDMEPDAPPPAKPTPPPPAKPTPPPPAKPTPPPAPDPEAKPETKPEVPKDPKVAKAALAAGKDLALKADALAKKGKADDAKAQYEAALAQLETAVAAGDDVNVYFPLAVVEDKLGRYDAAIKHYRMVTTAKTGVQPAIVKQAQAKLDDALTKVGQVSVIVTPEGATVSMNGAELGASPIGPMVLMPGTYTLSIVADGYQGKDVELKVEAGSESERKIELDKMQVVIEKHDVHADEPTDDKPQPPSKLPLYIGAGATGTLFLVSIVEDILAVHEHGIFVKADSTKDQRADAQLNGRFYAHVADACLVGTVVGAAFTAYWYVFRYKHAETQAKYQPREVPKVDMIPWVQPDAGGFAVAGRF
jgi:PEGA domain